MTNIFKVFDIILIVLSILNVVIYILLSIENRSLWLLIPVLGFIISSRHYYNKYLNECSETKLE